MYYYNKKDYVSFKKFADELTKTNVEQNPFYKDQKQLFIYILNILAFFYSYISEKTKDTEQYETYSTLSTSLVNQAEKIISSDLMTIVCKGFLYFTQGDYDNSDMMFSSVSDYSGHLPKHIVILAKLGLALNAYNQSNYIKAINFFVCLIKDYDYGDINIYECLGICYFCSGKLQKAKEIFEAVLEHDTSGNNNYKVKTYLAIIALNDVESKDFDIHFKKLIEAYEENEYNDCSIPALLISLCNMLLIAGKYTQTEELCKKLNAQLELGEIKYNNNNNNFNNYNNVNSSGVGKGKNMRKDFSEIKSAIYTINAKHLLCTGQEKKAFAYFIQSVNANPRNIEAQYGLGQINLNLQNISAAEKCFETCKSILDENKLVSFKVLKYLAYILSKTNKKEIEKAIQLYKTAIETKNDDIDCYVELAELLNLRAPLESLVYYKEAIKLIQKYKENKLSGNNDYIRDTANLYSVEILPEILNNIACILLRLDRVDEVEPYLNEARKIIKQELGVKHSKEGKTRLLSLKLGIDFNFALYYEKKAMFDYTHYICKRLIQENPYFIEAYVKLGELARMRGNKTKANEYIKLAIEKYFTEDKNHTKTIEHPTKQYEEDKEKDKDKTNDQKQQQAQTQNKENDTNDKSQEKVLNETKARRIISILNNPINPLIIQAYLHYEAGREQEAIQTLNQIIKQYDNKDPYTLTFLGNIYYSLAIEQRAKGVDNIRLNRAVELYFRALEYDKYNAMAAIGLCNCLSEYNYVDKALEIYKSITEIMENNSNAYVNESLIFMNEKKYHKASIILNKVLNKIFHGKNPTIQNLLAKCYIETKDFSKAETLLKQLIWMYPDNIVYRYNYGILLNAKSDEILNKNERKVSETTQAIAFIEKSMGLFETIATIIRRNERDDKLLRGREINYKCSEMINLSKVNLGKANEILQKDKNREQEMNEKFLHNEEMYQKIKIQDEKMDKLQSNKQQVDEEILLQNKRIAEGLIKMQFSQKATAPKKEKHKHHKHNHTHKHKHKHRHKHHKHKKEYDDEDSDNKGLDEEKEEEDDDDNNENEGYNEIGNEDENNSEGNNYDNNNEEEFGMKKKKKLKKRKIRNEEDEGDNSILNDNDDNEQGQDEVVNDDVGDENEVGKEEEPNIIEDDDIINGNHNKVIDE